VEFKELQRESLSIIFVKVQNFDKDLSRKPLIKEDEFYCFETSSYFGDFSHFFGYGSCHLFEVKLLQTGFKTRHNPINPQLVIANG